MSSTSIVFQALGGLELSIILFLVAAGLTLALKIMKFFNLAHATLYVVGGYVALAVSALTNNYLVGALAAVLTGIVIGAVLDRVLFRFFYRRDRVWQVMMTFGVMLILNDVAKSFRHDELQPSALPNLLVRHITLVDGIAMPIYRIVLIALGLAAACVLYYGIQHTPFGIRCRALASDLEMAAASGIRARPHDTAIILAGSALAAFAGVLAAPVMLLTLGTGDNILVLAILTVAIAGAGSLRALFVAAPFLGLADTIGRAWFIQLTGVMLPASIADWATPSINAVFIYVVGALLLAAMPNGIVPFNTRPES